MASTGERLAAELTRAILRGELLPGEPLRQSEWADTLGVSKVPLREALKILDERRLIVHHPNRGYFVAKIDLQQLAQIFRIREFLEQTLLSTVRWPGPAQIKTLRRHAARVAAAAQAGDIAQFLDEDHHFYFAIFDMSPLDFFAREARQLWMLCDQFRASFSVANRISDPKADYVRTQRASIMKALEDHDHKALNAVLDGQRAALKRFLNIDAAERELDLR